MSAIKVFSWAKIETEKTKSDSKMKDLIFPSFFQN